MLMVADLSGVAWRILDGASWRRLHHLYKYWVVSSIIRFRPKTIQYPVVVSNCSYITVLTVIIK